MSTTENFNVYKGLPYAVMARAEGKWDYTGNHTFTTGGQTLSVTMDNYNGLSSYYDESWQSADKIDFSNTVLPWKWQYNNTLDVSKYCLMPIGTNYENVIKADYIYNFDVVGSPTINNQTKVVSGFSKSNYIQMQSYPTNINNMEVQVRVKTPSDYDSYYMIMGQSTTNQKTPQAGMQKTNGHIYFSVSESGSGWVQIESDFAVEQNTWYWLKYTWNGNTSEFLYSLDGSTWISIGTASCSSIYWAETALFGLDTGTSPFGGSIDFSQTYIKINGSNWWVPTFTKTVKKQMNSTLVINGSPTISSDFVVSNFSTSNFLYAYSTDLPLVKGTTLFLKFTTGSNVSSSTVQLVYKKAGFITLQIQNSYMKTWNYQSTSTADIISVSANTTYYVKIEFTDTAKIFYVSTNGINWTSYTINDNVYNDNQYGSYFGRNSNAANPFNGSIDLKQLYAYTTSTGQEIWNALEDAKETLAGCTYNFTDDGSATTLNAFVVNGDESIVLTPDNSYTNGTLLGTVSIPAHTVYDYDNGYWSES